MENYPERHRNHEIETLSERYFINQIPTSWIVNKFTIDYGIDYNCEIAIDKKVSGMNFSVQLKGKEKEVNSDNAKISIKRTTINRWLKKLEPTMLIAYVINEDEAYWVWFEDNTVDLTSTNDTFTINIPKSNKLSLFDWDICIDYVDKIFKKRNFLYAIPEVNDKNKDAWKLFFEKKYENALILFYDIIKENPKNAIILEAISLAEYQLYNYQKALIMINKALDIDYNKNFRLNKASILTKQGYLNNDNLKIKEAITIFTDLIDENYISDTIFYNLGSALSKLGDFKSSIKYYEKALNLNPNKPIIWNNLGHSHMNLGNHNIEMQCYDKALQINPNQSETLFSKSSSLFKFFKETEQSLVLMLKAAELTDRYEYDNPNFFFWICQVYLYRNEIDNAKIWNEKGLNYFSSNEYLINQKEIIKEQNGS